MRIAILLAILLFPLLSFGADAPPSIRLPLSRVEPVAPTAVSELGQSELLVIEADVACRVIASRAGHLKIVPASGPMKVFALFVDATAAGEPELRTYEAKFLWLIRAAQPGDVELIVAPRESQVSDDSDVIRRTLVVSGGGPRPPPSPPGPDPPDPPQPNPPAPAPVTSFRVIFVRESGITLPASQAAVPGAKVIRDYLFVKTTRENGVTGWREYDPDTDATNEQPVMRALWEAVKPKIKTVPCIAVEVNGKVEIHPYPANAAEVLVLLKKAGN